MKDFKNSTKMQSGHSFSSQHGFTGSSGQSNFVKGYARKPPKLAKGGSVDTLGAQSTPAERQKLATKSLGAQITDTERKKISQMGKNGKCYAEGGPVGNSAVERTDPVTQFDKEHGGKGPLASGFKKGGALKRAMGGPVAMKSGGKSKKKGFQLGGTTGIRSKMQQVSHRPAIESMAPPRSAGFNRTPLIGQRR